MDYEVPMTAFVRDVGFYLRQARWRPLALTYHGVIEGYILSPEAYAAILRGQAAKEDARRDAHQAALLRMEAMTRG